MRLVNEYGTADSIVREYEGDGGARWTWIKAKADVPSALGWWESPRLRPGSTWADAAARAGQEDKYIDGMRCRYGEEW